MLSSAVRYKKHLPNWNTTGGTCASTEINHRAATARGPAATGIALLRRGQRCSLLQLQPVVVGQLFPRLDVPDGRNDDAPPRRREGVTVALSAMIDPVGGPAPHRGIDQGVATQLKEDYPLAPAGAPRRLRGGDALPGVLDNPRPPLDVAKREGPEAGNRRAPDDKILFGWCHARPFLPTTRSRAPRSGISMSLAFITLMCRGLATSGRSSSDGTLWESE